VRGKVEGFPAKNRVENLFKSEENVMAGTKAGGLKAAAKNKAKDPNFYAKIGAKGGQNGRTGGFAANPELARIAGAKGGRVSRRRKASDTAKSAE
jgi:general stress protein YciG